MYNNTTNEYCENKLSIARPVPVSMKGFIPMISRLHMLDILVKLISSHETFTISFFIHSMPSKSIENPVEVGLMPISVG
jgi:hypothetical protein